MIDVELKEALNQKIQAGEFGVDDFANFLTIFCQLGNNIDDLQDAAEDWNRKVQIVLDEIDSFWIAVEGGKFTAGKGKIDDANLTLAAAAKNAAQVFSGEQDGETAFLSGALKVQGDLPDAIKFHELLELVIEEIEY